MLPLPVELKPRAFVVITALFGVVALMLCVVPSPIRGVGKLEMPSNLKLDDGQRRYPAVLDFRCLRQACTLPLPEKICGSEVYISQVLVDPTQQRDRDGEWVQLRSDSASLLSLYGWQLRTSRSTRQLSSLSIHLDHPLTLKGRHGDHKLGPIQLRNRGDTLSLIDACEQVVSTLQWGGECPNADPGNIMYAPRKTTPRSSLHDRGVQGGCGQT